MYLSPEEIDILHDPIKHAAAGGPARTFLDELSYPDPVPNVQVIELFGQLAILCMREPNSQFAMTCTGIKPR
jgi:hypothetical protein